MGARRTWLFALLALTLACEGVIGEKDGAGTERTIDAGPPPSIIPDAAVDDASVPDGGSDMDGGMIADGGPCANGPLAAPIPNCQPELLPTAGDVHEDCFQRINQFRWECQCLPPLARWTDGEACADSNAEYDSVNGAHASFTDMPCGSGGRAQNECPGWSSNGQVIEGCLQMMWDEGPEDGDPGTVNGHYESMASTSYTQVACGFYTTLTGEVWGVQNFD